LPIATGNEWSQMTGEAHLWVTAVCHMVKLVYVDPNPCPKLDGINSFAGKLQKIGNNRLLFIKKSGNLESLIRLTNGCKPSSKNCENSQ
jgi:hypothetical protein